MARRKSLERSGVTDTVEKRKSEMQETGERIEENTEDVEITRETLDSLEGGTQEGADQIDQHIEEAQDASVQEFEDNTNDLEQIQGETEEYEGELKENTDTLTSDVDRISGARDQLHSDAAGSELDEARSAAEQDIEFLQEHEQRAKDARDESQRLHEEHRNRVDAARRS